MVSSIAPLSFFSFILFSFSLPFLSISISHSRQKIIRAHRERNVSSKSMHPPIWVSQMEGKLSNYLESPKSPNSAHQPAGYIPPGKEKRRKGDPLRARWWRGSVSGPRTVHCTRHSCIPRA